MCVWWWGAARGLAGLRKEVQTRPHPASSSQSRLGAWTLQSISAGNCKPGHIVQRLFWEKREGKRDPSDLAPSTRQPPGCHGPTHGFQDEQKVQVPLRNRPRGEAARLEALQPRQSLG